MATASSSDDVCEWQLTKNAVSERIQHMYRNPLLADVHFTVTDRNGSSSPKVKIPCHKFILAVSSPVFYMMFYGELKERSDYVDLPDCDSEGFLEFLRFIYCDEVELTGDCVIQVLYLAKKYMIPALVNRCRSFLQENINPVNVLDLLPVVEKMEENQLNDVCWNVIDKHAREVLESAQDFYLENNNLLVSMLKRDTLDAKEVEIFQAVNRMAESICVKRGKTPSGKEKRTIVGEKLLTLIRFPIMPEKEFAKHVADTKILSESEVVLMFMYFNLNRRPGEFSCMPRCLNDSTVQRCKRLFTVTAHRYRAGCSCSDTDLKDSLSLTVNIPIALGGIRFLGSKGRKFKVRLKLNCEFIMDERSLTAREDSTSSWEGFDVVFGQYYPLQPKQPYILEAFVKGPLCVLGTDFSTSREVVCENITFKFDRNTERSLQNAKTLIAEILFKPLGSNY